MRLLTFVIFTLVLSLSGFTSLAQETQKVIECPVQVELNTAENGLIRDILNHADLGDIVLTSSRMLGTSSISTSEEIDTIQFTVTHAVLRGDYIVSAGAAGQAKSKIAVNHIEGDIILEGTSTELNQPLFTEIADLKSDPNNEEIFYVADLNGLLYTSNLTLGLIDQIDRYSNETVIAAAVSPNGPSVLYITEENPHQLRLINIGTTGAVSITLAEDIQSFEWSGSDVFVYTDEGVYLTDQSFGSFTISELPIKDIVRIPNGYFLAIASDGTIYKLGGFTPCVVAQPWSRTYANATYGVYNLANDRFAISYGPEWVIFDFSEGVPYPESE